MNLKMLIAPTDLREYAKDLGWRLLKEAAADRLYVMDNPQYERRQLVFPMDSTAPDYSEAVSLAVRKIASIEGRSEEAVVKSILEVGDDAISFRVSSQRSDDAALPLSFVSSMLEGTERLLLSSACTVLKPQTHHPRLSRSEAQQFLESTKFRHTQPGSFVLNVSCPVKAIDFQGSFLPGEADLPFVRRTTSLLNSALHKLISSIETDTLDELVAEIKADERPLISANLCEALTYFEDKSLKNSIEIGITWAATLPRPESQSRLSINRVQRDYFSRIEEVRREIRSTESHVEDVFPATVERLDGDMGPDGKRAGCVILRLLTPDTDDLVRAKANLTWEQYEKASKAHMTDGTFVMVAGKLHPGRQPRELNEISIFELMNSD